MEENTIVENTATVEKTPAIKLTPVELSPYGSGTAEGAQAVVQIKPLGKKAVFELLVPATDEASLAAYGLTMRELLLLGLKGFSYSVKWPSVTSEEEITTEAFHAAAQARAEANRNPAEVAARKPKTNPALKALMDGVGITSEAELLAKLEKLKAAGLLD